VAILTLHASAPAVGALVALPWLAFLVVGLPAGALVDRVPQRPLLVATALGRAAVLVAIPALAAAGGLTLLTLYGAATALGVLTVVAEVAARSCLPDLVAREELVAGNTALTLGEGVAQVGGPAAGGALIQVLGAPLALVADAGAALVAALLVRGMGTPEEAATPRQEPRPTVWGDLHAGLAAVVRHPLLRPLLLASTIANLGTAIANGVLLLFAYRALHLTPGVVGMVTALGSVGFIVGACATGWLTRTLGAGRTLCVVSVLYATAYLLVPLGLLGAPALLVGLWRLLFSAADPPYSVTVASLRQAATVSTMQGRVTGTMNALGWGALGVGALMGGVLGARLGLVPTIVLGAGIALAGALPTLVRPVRTLAMVRTEHEGPSQRVSA
jgi:predicted MFS family arabinose efflux permease